MCMIFRHEVCAVKICIINRGSCLNMVLKNDWRKLCMCSVDKVFRKLLSLQLSERGPLYLSRTGTVEQPRDSRAAFHSDILD